MNARRVALVVAVPQQQAVTTDAPRDHLFREMFPQTYDESVLPADSKIAAKAPRWLRLAARVHERADQYDAIVSWGEMITMSLMALQRATRAPKPHVAILSRFSKPKLEIPLRLLGGTLRAMVTWCEAQRDYAIERMGISPGRIFLVKHYVDEIFWNGAPAPPTDLIASAGAENRDYATLIEALRDAPVRCHVATDRVRIDGPLMSRRFTVAQLAQTATPNVTFGRRNLRELRELYARSRFVVLPLQPNNIDNGVTVLLEAMAMGKAVICSQTEGQRGVLQHGVTGLYVPPKDPRAMREAILSLWNDPARAEAMGRAGRAYIEKHHTLEGFCRNVRTAIDVALDGGAATRTGDIPVERTPYAA